MRIVIDKKWRVKAQSAIIVPLPAGAVWGQMRDWQRFITRDPLHRSVRVTGKGSASDTPRGTRIVIEHRLLGIGPDRVGRILRWREGCGYVFSDLSGRGVRRGFPHVCSYEVEVLTEDTCRVTAWVRGKWTATWIPRWAARAWIWWVLRGTEVRLASELAAYARWRRRQGRHVGEATRPG